MNNTNPPIIVEQVFDKDSETLWAAITDAKQMPLWFFDNIPAFETQVGFQTSFLVQSGERSFTHLWEIIEVIPGQKIKYDWRYKEYEGVGFVTFELFEQEEQRTLLRLSNEGIESFPQDIPEFAKESCQGGWEYFIQGNLLNYINSLP